MRGLYGLTQDVTQPVVGMSFDPNRYRREEEAQPSNTSAIALAALMDQGGSGGAGRGKLGRALTRSYEPGFDHEVLYGPQVEGHANHLHLSADRGLRRIGNILERKGFDVGEHSAFGGVNPVHTAGSHHEDDNALDINYNGGGRWKNEQQALAWLKRRIRKIYGDDAYYG